MDTLFYLGVILVLGALTEWVAPKFHLPRVVGYLILGLIIGPEVLGIIPSEFVHNSYIITELSLSIIALLVGATLKFSTIKSHAKEIIYITLFQSIGTFVVVAAGFMMIGDILGFSPQNILIISLILGGISSATAPAASIALVHELRAKGKFTSTLLAVVAADDAISLIIFTFAITIGISFIGTAAFELSNIFSAFMTIILSVILGVVAGFITTVLEKLFAHHKGMETIATLGMIFVVYSLSEYWKLEPLLSSMAMGIVMVNVSKDFDLVEEEIDNHLAEIIFMLFFILSAMHLKFSAVFALPVAIEAYVLFRVFGKVVGSYLGAYLSDSSKNIKKYMGFALLPQAGVAIGLALSLQNHEGLEEIAPIILNIVIATTFIHELIGPIFTAYALKKSGETAS